MNVAVKRPRSVAPPEPSPGSRLLQPETVFAPDSFWSNNLLADSAPLHASSSGWVANLISQMGLDISSPSSDGKSLNPLSPQVPGKAWFNLDTGASPVYVVAADQPLVPVAQHNVLTGTSWPAMDELHEVLMAGVPIPVGANVDTSSDKSLVIYQPSTGSYWELWVAENVSGTDPQGRPYQWLAYGGGRMLSVWGRKGTYKNLFASGVQIEDYTWGHTATGLPMIGGIITPEEWASTDTDVIKHPLHMVSGNASTTALLPAHRTDGQEPDTWIREGCRVRFPASWDWSYLNESDYVSMQVKKLGKAIQRFGFFITDRTGGGCAFRFRSPQSYYWEGLPKPYTLNGFFPNDFMWRLPWQSAEVLDPSVSPE